MNYPPQWPSHYAPSPPPPQRGSAVIVIVVVVIALMLSGGGAAAWFLLRGTEPEVSAETPRALGTGAPSPTVSPPVVAPMQIAGASGSATGNGRVVVERALAPVWAASAFGLPLDRTFRQLSGADGMPIFDGQRIRSEPVSDTRVSFSEMSSNTEFSAHMSATGNSGGVDLSDSSKTISYRAVRIERVDTIDDTTALRLATGDAAYYIQRIYYGRAFALFFRSNASDFSSELRSQFLSGTSSGVVAFRTHRAELRTDQWARGFAPLDPENPVGLDIAAFREDGPVVPVLVDYAAIPGSAQSQTREMRIRITRVTAQSVGSDPFNQQPRFTVTIQCSVNGTPEGSPGSVIDQQLSAQQPASTTWEQRVRLGPEDEVSCQLSGIFHAGGLGGVLGQGGQRPMSQQAIEWRNGRGRRGSAALVLDDIRLVADWQVSEVRGTR